MTKREAIDLLLNRAGGDPHKALALAVEWVALVGDMVSAGYTRSAPQEVRHGKV